MKFHAQQAHLSHALAIVGRAVPARATLPVLSHVLLTATDDTLTVAATNLDMCISHQLPATVERAGACALPARLLDDYVDLLDRDQPVAFELQEKNFKAHLACGRFEANIAGLGADDFPPAPAVEGGPRLSIGATLLKDAIEQAAFAAAADDARPVLAGVLLRVDGSALTLAAADGFRLAVRTLQTPAAPGGDLQVVVPARTLAEVARLLPDDATAEVTFGCAADHSQARFAFGHTAVTTRLIEGQFPDYERIIPAEASSRLTVATADLLRATRAAAVFARDNSNIVRLEVAAPAASDGSLARVLVKSASAEFGDNEGQLDAVLEGEPTSIAFNSRYLRDILERVDAAHVLVQLSGSTRPGVLRPATEPDGATTTHVVMPRSVGR